MKIKVTNEFKRNIKKYKKEKSLIEKVEKQIKKISENPEIGQFLTGDKKGQRKIYITPFRLLYYYHKNSETIYLIDFDHRDIIYKK